MPKAVALMFNMSRSSTFPFRYCIALPWSSRTGQAWMISIRKYRLGEGLIGFTIFGLTQLA